MPAIKSDAQRRFIGAIASGSLKEPGFSKKSAQKTLEENKGRMKNLPEHVKKGK